MDINQNLKKYDAYAVLRIKDFRLFIFARFILTIAIQMQSIIVGWQIYDITRDPFSLGLIGLAEALPFIVVALFAGHVADIINRKKIILVTIIIYFFGALTLFLLSFKFNIFFAEFGCLPIYGVVFLTGIARGFHYPAQSAFMAQLVPRKLYANSSTWNSTIWHIAAISGPAIGGLIYGFFGIDTAYFIVVCLVIFSFCLFMFVKNVALPAKVKKESLIESLTSGVRFVFKNQILLGALALDMFAVLFGGAVAILPVFAREILELGPEGLGFLRAAPAFGAVLMSLILAHKPPLKHAGVNLLVSVSGFGMCIILFAFSTNFYLSFLLLAFSGMFDNVSVIIRNTIIQLFTPDNMRGRVASVNSIFIGSSNEIGSFESGSAAKILGLVPSVVFGGGMTLMIALSTFKFAPKLKKLNLLSYMKEKEENYL
ncbi:MAG: MFS transporter [Bacteroidetes bacterium CG2_30_32_10]|nr:MAG: MFS transporter [Bacteroidetes bacterium CG2_30_32_10]